MTKPEHHFVIRTSSLIRASGFEILVSQDAGGAAGGAAGAVNIAATCGRTDASAVMCVSVLVSLWPLAFLVICSSLRSIGFWPRHVSQAAAVRRIGVIV